MKQEGELQWRGAWLATGWAMVAAVVYLSLAPISLEAIPAHSDKLHHVVAYGALMLWFCQMYEPSSTRRYLAVAFVVLGVGLECAQGLTDYRTFEYADMWVNACGVAVGWLAAPPRVTNLFVRFESLLRARRAS